MNRELGTSRLSLFWLGLVACLLLVVGPAFQEAEFPEQDSMLQIEDVATPESEVAVPPSPIAEPTEAAVVGTPTIVPDEPDATPQPTATPTPGTPTPVRPVIPTPATRTPTAATRREGPTGPSSVSVRALAIGTVGIEWTDSSENEQGFRIDVSGPTSFSRTLPPNTVDYNIGGLRTGTYCFAIVAFNSDGESPPVSVCIGVR